MNVRYSRQRCALGKAPGVPRASNAAIPALIFWFTAGVSARDPVGAVWALYVGGRTLIAPGRALTTILTVREEP